MGHRSCRVNDPVLTTNEWLIMADDSWWLLLNMVLSLVNMQIAGFSFSTFMTAKSLSSNFATKKEQLDFWQTSAAQVCYGQRLKEYNLWVCAGLGVSWHPMVGSH